MVGNQKKIMQYFPESRFIRVDDGYHIVSTTS